MSEIPEKIMVSVLCLTYNHEKYIRQCLDGCLMQRTSFPFEVLINEDASSDGTADIIREYEEKNPEIIKPFYQQQNQYSQHVQILFDILLPKAKGKYIALCEGDDYWIDPLKLQKQVDALEEHSECHLCVGRTLCVKENGSATKSVLPKRRIESGIIESEEFLNIEVYDIFHLSTFLMRGSSFRQYGNNLPQFTKICWVGDIPYRLYFASLGPVYYYDNIMSCYRLGSISSVSKSFESSKKTRIALCNNMIETMQEYERYTEGRFHSSIEERIKKNKFMILYYKNEFKALLKPEYKSVFMRRSWKRKVDIIMSAFFPNLYSQVKKRLGL